MTVDLEELITHDMSEDCPICRAQDMVSVALLPATAAWEMTSDLPKFSLALHGAAELLGVILAEGVEREALDDALAALLDDIEQRLAEDKAMGGPPQGSA